MSRKNKKPLKIKGEGYLYVKNPAQALHMISHSEKAEKITAGNYLHPPHGNGKEENTVTNKRKYDRASMLASLELILEGGYCLEGYAVNASFGGIGLYSPKALLVGTKIQIKITFVDGTGIELFEVISGTVVWCKPAGQLYSMGIEFINLDPVEHGMFKRYLEMAENIKENST